MALSGVAIPTRVAAGAHRCQCVDDGLWRHAVTTAPGGINLSGATIAAGSTCAFSVTVTAPAAGIFVNTTGAASSSNGGNGGLPLQRLLRRCRC